MIIYHPRSDSPSPKAFAALCVKSAATRILIMPRAFFAADRFGYGPRPGDRDDGYRSESLTRQFALYDPKPAALWAVAPRAEVAAAVAAYLQEARAVRQGRSKAEMDSSAKDAIKAARKLVARATKDHYGTAVDARIAAALVSTAPFVERLVHFWANHFAVSADKLTIIGFAALLEVEAIRPHVLGRFEDMLVAVEQHPAMLLYLDQAQSIGPTSKVGTRVQARGGKKGGLNENLAREILELHTLGVRTGYDQSDVTEFARALTGWTVSGVTNGPAARALGLDRNPGDFAFVEVVHEPGPRTIMGKRYTEGGSDQARRILSDLARHPATARHIATKLARHFAADDPPPALIARLEESFLQSGGDLIALYTVLAEAPEIWIETTTKFKTPWDWMVSSYRALGVEPAQVTRSAPLLTQLGQPVWRPGSPAGYDDIAASWAGPDALFRRVELAAQLTQRFAAGADPGSLRSDLSGATREAITRAESRAQGAALFLVSPEFLRR
jgi:uncharacterized protein (DUF1800 family)